MEVLESNDDVPTYFAYLRLLCTTTTKPFVVSSSRWAHLNPSQRFTANYSQAIVLISGLTSSIKSARVEKENPDCRASQS